MRLSYFGGGSRGCIFIFAGLQNEVSCTVEIGDCDFSLRGIVGLTLFLKLFFLRLSSRYPGLDDGLGGLPDADLLLGKVGTERTLWA